MLSTLALQAADTWKTASKPAHTGHWALNIPITARLLLLLLHDSNIPQSQRVQSTLTTDGEMTVPLADTRTQVGECQPRGVSVRGREREVVRDAGGEQGVG